MGGERVALRWFGVVLCGLSVWACGEATTDPGDVSDAGEVPDVQSPPDVSDVFVDTEDIEPQPTYYGAVKAVIDTRCAGCHQDGAIAPFPLTTYDEVFVARALVEGAVLSGSMPPWPPAEDCGHFEDVATLLPEERAALLDWVAAGGPEGEPSSAAEPTPAPATLDADVLLTMAEPYHPQGQPDAYRCFLMDWEREAATYATAFEVRPGDSALVHHVIIYVVEPDRVADFQAMDASYDGPGYECFGGPAATGTAGPTGGLGMGVRWMASWVPGTGTVVMPPDTGIVIHPGSKIIMQMHYYTPVPSEATDQTTLAMALSDEVGFPASVMPYTNIEWLTGATPMTIPAGEAAVSHEHTMDLTNILDIVGWEAGLTQGDSFVIHNVSLHMHKLGTAASLVYIDAAGEETCLLDIPDWDFDWQMTFTLKTPVTFTQGDQMRLHCTWDNSAANQPLVGGVQPDPIDVKWGDGTNDEMCLGLFTLTATE